MKYKLWIIGFLTVVFLTFTTEVEATDIETAELTHLDAVLVLDVSGSMNFADPGRISYEAMMLFIDLLPVSGDRVGIISYNDQIVALQELTLIRSREDKDYLKDFIAGLQIRGWTDITVGLMEAIRILDDSHRPPNRPVIILFTDGNNHLGPGNPRTQEDLDNDTEQIIVDAVARGYPIYTIGLNYDGTLNHAYIQRFADETGALSFETANAEDLPDILSAIFASQMDIQVTSAGIIYGNDDFQEITVDIPYGIAEANIIFLSGSPIEAELLDPLGRPIPFDGHWAVFSQANHYAMLKVILPVQGEWTIRVLGAADDRIRVNMLHVTPAEEEIIPEEPEPVPTPVPAPTPAPPAPAEELHEEPDNGIDTVLIAAVAAVAAVMAMIAVLLFKKKQARVFTGRLAIEITNHHTGEKSAPQYRNLIEYGRKTDLHTLLRGQGSPLLAAVTLSPSPTAPSHLPQLLVKCTSKDLKFKKDFMKCDASKGIAMSMRTELRIEIEAENKSIVLRYME